jgi:glucose-6-phosphate isomerase
MMQTLTGLDIAVDPDTMGFRYGPGVRGPEPEFRTLDAIRPSLLDPACSGPSPVYSIAMDVRREADEAGLQERCLLFGVVAYAAGRLGREPVRSQGHVHATAPHSGWSPPELFEIWEGRAIIYAQQFAADDPGKCVAVLAGPGEKVVVPPGWAHAVINADPGRRMVFGAWCDRQYGFDYTGVRAHGGLAHFPVIVGDPETANEIAWVANQRYRTSRLEVRGTRTYPELGLNPVEPIYSQYLSKPESVEWVAWPGRFAEIWKNFVP